MTKHTPKTIVLKEKAQDILNNPNLNKGSAFTYKEREELGLMGLLPYNVATIEEQVKRRYENFLLQPSELAKHVFLNMLQKRNETLFYRLVSEHITEMLPLIYTPTVGAVSSNFSSLYSHQKGLYLSYPDRDSIEKVINNIPLEGIDVVVATDGERVLGLGDLGVGGMAISVGKLSLYTLFGGIDPSRTLPLMIDVGTNNPKLLQDPLYLGWRHERITGKEYDAFIEMIISLIKKRVPNVLFQWEDFGKGNAKKLLTRHRKEICSFNDDIQGTAAVVLAAIFGAIKQTKSRLSEQRIAVFGGGSAGIGICEQIKSALLAEGVSEKDAAKQFYVIDIDGLFTSDSLHMDESQRSFAQKKEDISSWEVNDFSRVSLSEVIENAKPTILIGVSGQGGFFKEAMIRSLAKGSERPIIFTLSNPTSCSEAHPQDLINWTEGRAIIATGSPFAPVTYKGKTFKIPQCNNVYIFPGVGLGVIASGAKEVTDALFICAAKALSEEAELTEEGALFPPFEELKGVSERIAFAIAECAENEGIAEKQSPKERLERIKACHWEPIYPHYVRG